MSGADLQGDGVPSVNRPETRCPAGARRGLPILPQEALVLGLGLDAGHSCSHLQVNGRHLVLHQAANLQVLLQDLLPAPRQEPWSMGPRAGLGWAARGP